MQKFDDDSIQNALDKITASNIGNENFICVEFIAEDPKILVRYCDEASISSKLPSTIQILTIDKTNSIQVSVLAITGPKIISHLGDLRIHPPYVQTSAELAGEMGGDQCRNANSMNYYGTIAFYLKSAEFQMSGRCNGRCVTTNALVSNNHVIARNDAGKPGEVIWTPLRNDTARLQCVIPLTCYANVDLAFAQVNDMTGIPTATIRIIGKISGFRRPNIGEAIKKYGARTGYTTGSVTGKTNIQVGGIIYRGVFSTTGGFGCPGDSGSAVVSSDNNAVGMYSWGDDIPCENNPTGYFYTFIDPGFSAESKDHSKCLLNFDEELASSEG